MNALDSTSRSRLVAAALIAVAVFVVGMRGGGFDVVERHVIGVVAWLVVLGSLPFTPPPRRPALIVAALIGAFALFTGLSAFWSESAERSVGETTRALSYLGVFLAAALTAQRLGDRRPLIAGVTVGLGALLLIAALSRLEPALFPAQEFQRLRTEIRPRLTYPLNYWNGLGALAALVLPLFLYWATNPALTARLRAVAAAALPLTGLVLYLTFSRGGLVAAILAAGIFLIASPTRLAAVWQLLLGVVATAPLVLLVKSYRPLNDGLIETDAARSQGHRVLILLVVILVATWLLSPVVDRLGSRVNLSWQPRLRTRVGGTAVITVLLALTLSVVAFGDVGNRWESFRSGWVSSDATRIENRYLSASGNGRYEYWSAAVDAWETKPFIGRGAGTWEYWWQRHATLNNFIRDSHSIVFDNIAELGLIGVVLLLAMFGSILWAAVAARRAAREPSRAAEAACLVAALVAFTLSASIDWVWEIPAVAGTFFALAGIAATATPSRTGERTPARHAARSGARASVAIAVFGWLSICLCMLPLLSNWQINQSQEAARNGDFDDALKHAENARSLQFYAAGPKIQQALVLRERGGPNVQAALAPAQGAVRDEPTNWRAWLVLAQVYRSLGDEAAYRRQLTIARSLSPRAVYWVRIGFPLPPDQLPR